MTQDSEQFKEYYKKKSVTGTYDAQREGTAYRRKKRAKELAFFLDLIDKQETDTVLELGCSSGFLTQHLGRVTAIDTSEGMLDITRTKNPHATCLAADMFDLPFEKNNFNKIVTMRVWVHLPSQELRRAIREARRVLQKGGYLIFDIEEKSLLRRVAGFFYKGFFGIKGFTIYQYSLAEVRRILAQEGFRVDRVRYLNHRVGRQIILRARDVRS